MWPIFPAYTRPIRHRSTPDQQLPAGPSIAVMTARVLLLRCRFDGRPGRCRAPVKRRAPSLPLHEASSRPSGQRPAAQPTVEGPWRELWFGHEQIVALGDTAERLEVLAAHRLVGDRRVAQRHAVVAMPKQLHDPMRLMPPFISDVARCAAAGASSFALRHSGQQLFA